GSDPSYRRERERSLRSFGVRRRRHARLYPTHARPPSLPMRGERWTDRAMRIELRASLLGIVLVGAACGSSGGGGGGGGGPGWTKIFDPMSMMMLGPDTLGGSIVIDGSRIIAGTNKGVLISGDDGGTWQRVTMGLPADAMLDAMIAL